MTRLLFRKIIQLAYIFQFLLMGQGALACTTPHYIPLLKEMFAEVALAKNDKAIPKYYDKDFELYSNGKMIRLNEYLHLHESIYKTPIQYKIRYDDTTLVEQGNRVAARLFITTKNPNENAHEIEVILIAEYKKDKLYRLWELTYPDWSKMKSFEKISNVS